MKRKRKITIFSDQDGVLIDKAFHCNYSFCELGRLLIKNKAILVPSSDTPAERLRFNFQLFTGVKINTVIAERGGVILHKQQEVFRLQLPSSEIVKYLQALRHLAKSFKATIYTGDSVTWIRTNKIFKSNASVIIFDAFRKTSIGYYARRTNQSGLAMIDDIFYDEFTTEAKKIPRPSFFEVSDYNQTYGIALISSAQATKTAGFLNYLRLFGLEDQADDKYYMIGDYKTDIIEDPRMTLLAVGNADDELKEKATFISNFPQARGMMDCINYALSL